MTVAASEENLWIFKMISIDEAIFFLFRDSSVFHREDKCEKSKVFGSGATGAQAQILFLRTLLIWPFCRCSPEALSE